MEGFGNGSRLHVNVERWGSIVVLDLTGRLTIEDGIDRLRGLTQWLPRLRGNLVILDLQNVHQLDCSGIGQLAGLCNDVRRLGGAFVLVNVHRRQRRLLQLVGLVPVFPVFDSRRGALSWFHEMTARLESIGRPPEKLGRRPFGAPLLAASLACDGAVKSREG